METIKKGRVKLPFWLRVFLVALGLYILGIVLLIFTQNVILFPTVVMLGSFMVPISYVAFFYERSFIRKISPFTLVIGFLYGGILGVFIASTFDPLFIRRLDLLTAFEVGFIEEFAKIAGLFWIMRKRTHTSQLSGIVIGAAVGMGFAAFESTGYAFAAFLDSAGSLTDTVIITLLRGVTSPLGHGTWTAILAGVLFKGSGPKRFRITTRVITAYLTVVILHGLWDGLPSIFVNYVLPGIDFFIAEGFVALVGVIILVRSWRSAKAEELRLFSTNQKLQK